ncbi:MAG TPA: alkaline phosphatase family protein [Methyloversatilis sp.]
MWPDFEGGSILDLMDSVVSSRGGLAGGAGLRDVDASRWRAARSVILMVLDGVGMAQLDLLPEESFMRRHLKTTLTSVFPSTTAAAITTFMTAKAPAAHGLTGWHVRFSEAGLDGRTLAILPVSVRGGGDLPCSQDEVLAQVCGVPPLFASLPGASQVISPDEIVDSPFNLRHSSGARRTGYRGLGGMLDAMSRALRPPAPPSYIYAYWPDFDHCAHKRGTGSAEARELLHTLDEALGQWAQSVVGSGTLLLVTADHGFIDAPPQRLIEIEDFPELADCLAGPLSGERRAVFCHVKPGRTWDFERGLQALEHACVVWPSSELVAAGRFGPGAMHPHLRERLGDYTLEMKADWTLRDTMPGERRHRLIGVHGGTSGDEMRVPLVCCEL